MTRTISFIACLLLLNPAQVTGGRFRLLKATPRDHGTDHGNIDRNNIFQRMFHQFATSVSKQNDKDDLDVYNYKQGLLREKQLRHAFFNQDPSDRNGHNHDPVEHYVNSLQNNEPTLSPSAATTFPSSISSPTSPVTNSPITAPSNTLAPIGMPTVSSITVAPVGTKPSSSTTLAPIGTPSVSSITVAPVGAQPIFSGTSFPIGTPSVSSITVPPVGARPTSYITQAPTLSSISPSLKPPSTQFPPTSSSIGPGSTISPTMASSSALIPNSVTPTSLIKSTEIPTTFSPTAPTTLAPSRTMSPTIIFDDLRCPGEEWVLFQKKCYLSSELSQMDHYVCLQTCSGLGAQMPCITDLQTNSVLASLIVPNVPLWTGLVGDQTDGSFHWENEGCSSDFTFWVDGQSGTAESSGTCAVMGLYTEMETRDVDAWNVSDCSVPGTCVCETEAESCKCTEWLCEPTSNEAVSPPCPVGEEWSLFKGTCYYNSGATNTMDYATCKATCESLGAEMLCVPDQSVNSYIASYIEGRGVEDYENVWLGLNDIVEEGNYEWESSSCSSSFVFWAKGKPDNHDGIENCVEVGWYVPAFNVSDYDRWNDKKCDDKSICGCQRPARPCACQNWECENML